MKIQNNSDIKYQFSVVTWGGFYNEEYKRIHGYEEGKKVFDSKQEREEYINKLQLTETELSAHHLAMTFDEGFTVNTSVTLHRVIKLKDKFYYSKNEVNVWSNFEGNFATASYQM